MNLEANFELYIQGNVLKINLVWDWAINIWSLKGHGGFNSDEHYFEIHKMYNMYFCSNIMRMQCLFAFADKGVAPSAWQSLHVKKKGLTFG